MFASALRKQQAWLHGGSNLWHAGIFGPGYFSTDNDVEEEGEGVSAAEAGRFALVMLCPSGRGRGGGKSLRTPSVLLVSRIAVAYEPRARDVCDGE